MELEKLMELEREVSDEIEALSKEYPKKAS